MQKLSFLFICVATVSVLDLIDAGSIAYPVDELFDKSKKNANGRKPVWVPGRCAENEILYPGDNDYDWVCDCKPAYVYHPKSGECYMPHQQGPCESGKILVLRKNKVVPECQKNPCKYGEVKFEGNCSPYGESDKCNTVLSEELLIDAVTLMPKCIRTSNSPYLQIPINTYVENLTPAPSGINVGQRLGDESELVFPSNATVVYSNALQCQKGSKRNIINTCKNDM